MKLAIVAALVAAMPSPADACSAPNLCLLNQFVPADGATVPANLPAIVWWGAGDAAMVELHDDAGNQIALTAVAVDQLAPATPLVAGTHYTLVDNNPCGGTARTSSFTASAAAPMPTALGTARAIDAGLGNVDLATINGGSCSVEFTGAREGLQLDLDASALPWKDALLFTTQIDGLHWVATAAHNSVIPPGSSWVGRGTDLVFAACTAADGGIDVSLAEGAHSGAFTATLANTALALTSSSADFSLQCAAPSSGGGGGCSTGGGPGVAMLLGLLALRRRRS